MRPVTYRPNRRAKPCFALFVCLLAGLPGAGASPCLQPTDGNTHQVARVFDGDTLLLKDGRKLRLAGIDTPELGRDRQPSEPFARAALKQLRGILKGARQRILLRTARDPKDRYGRLLAHAYTPDGKSIQVRLLRSGLALTNIQPPNLSHLDCYLAAENSARRKKLALWRDLPSPARELDRSHRGLALIRGVVRNTRQTRNSLWIRLEGGTALRIARSDLEEFSDLDSDSLPGSRLEARGWPSFYRGRPTLRIHHPAALTLIADNNGN